MINFILEIYKIILKILIIIFGGTGIYLILYYPLFLLLGNEAILPYIMGILGVIVYFIAIFNKHLDGDL